MARQYYVYIMTNYHNSVLYTGISNNLIGRVYTHKQKSVSGFTARYNIKKLVYYEICNNPGSAITREKQIKGGSRADKLLLIRKVNPKFEDLYYKLRSEQNDEA